MKVFDLPTDNPIKIPDGAILKFLGSDYDIRTCKYNNVFELIGGPVRSSLIPIKFVEK